MKKIKKLLSMALATILTVSALSVNAFAKTITLVEYDPVTKEVTCSEQEVNEFAARALSPRYIRETAFDIRVPVYPQSKRIPIDIPLDDGEEYIYVDFDSSNPDCKARLRDADTGTYITEWLTISPYGVYFRGFDTEVTYNVYLSSITYARDISGVVYTQ